jgi:hypothetical protein
MLNGCNPMTLHFADPGRVPGIHKEKFPLPG